MRGRTRILVGGMAGLGGLGAVVGANVLIAWSIASPHPTPPAAPRVAAPISGRGAAGGHITESTLHAAHVRGDEPVACASCHEVALDGFTAPDRRRCLICHPDREVALHASVAEDEEAAECTTCHDFTDREPVAVRAWRCEQCHPRPHDRDPPALAGFAGTCANCHHPHGEASRAPSACTSCHEDRVTGHQTTSDSGTGSCLACHRQHDAAVNAQGRCVSCHGEHEPRVPPSALFAGGHERCTTCHASHDFTRATVKRCQACHAQRALASDRVGAHAACTSCHDRHGVAASAATCRRCHERVEPSHGRGGEDCLGCHPPHAGGSARTVAVLACSSCHAEVATSDRARHGGARCADCHRPHAFTLTGGASFCLGCHATRTGSRPAIAVGNAHRECARCHGDDPHAPQAPPPCATCHVAQGSTVPRGHATCVACHEPHGATLRGRAATCTGCHADRTTGPHRDIEGGCARCHRPHGPGRVASPPPCASCHERAALPLLHASSGHQLCNSCHRSHAPPASDRASCLRCHQELRDHQPDAASCTACHPFRGGS